MNTKYKASHFETVYKETIKNCQISLYIKKKKERKHKPQIGGKMFEVHILTKDFYYKYKRTFTTQ